VRPLRSALSLTRVVVGWSLCTAATGLAWNFPSLVAARLLFGAGESGCFPGIARMFRTWLTPVERNPAEGIKAASARWGAALTPALMTGYLNREADTRKRLIDGWYDTGDVMRRDENGFVFFVGRADDMFQCGGENVYPGEVEKLLGRHPDVAQVCVVPVADEIKYQLPVAFVVPKPGARPSEDALRRFALDNGPAYAHPRAVWFVDELPLAGTNKIDRKALIDRAAAAYAREGARRV